MLERRTWVFDTVYAFSLYTGSGDTGTGMKNRQSWRIGVWWGKSHRVLAHTAEVFLSTGVGLQVVACFPLGGLAQWVVGSLLLWHLAQR